MCVAGVVICTGFFGEELLGQSLSFGTGMSKMKKPSSFSSIAKTSTHFEFLIVLQSLDIRFVSPPVLKIKNVSWKG